MSDHDHGNFVIRLPDGRVALAIGVPIVTENDLRAIHNEITKALAAPVLATSLPILKQ